MPSNPLPIGQFNHVTLPSVDLPKAERFYVDLLGFRVLPRPSFSFDGRWLYREEVGPLIHLNHNPKHEVPEGPLNTRGAHFAMQCSNLQEVVDQLSAAGIEYAVRTLPDFGHRQVFFRDPDGNLIELGEWPEVRKMVELLQSIEPRDS